MRITRFRFGCRAGHWCRQFVNICVNDSRIAAGPARSSHRRAWLEDPALRMMLEADVRIVFDGSRRGHQQDRAVFAQLCFRQANQFFADAPVLERHIDGQVGQVATEVKVGDGARHADQASVGARRHQQVAVIDHALHALQIIDGTPQSERRAVEHIDELSHIHRLVDFIDDRVHVSLLSE